MTQLDDGVKLQVLLLEELIERFGLRNRAWESVEDEALGCIGLVDPVGNDADHDIVRHQATARHDGLGLQPDRRLRLNRRTQHFAGGQLNDAVAMHKPLRLGPLARPRRSQKNQSH